MIIIKSGSMHTLKILSTNYLTHDVKRFVVEKPKDFYYSPGHSAHISINVPGWEEEIRPFTFTSLNDWPHLEFIVKIYENRKGVTDQLGKLNAGAEIFLHDVFGSIRSEEHTSELQSRGHLVCRL